MSRGLGDVYKRQSQDEGAEVPDPAVLVELVSAAVENHDGPGPYGSKGISEGALLCTAGALGAAVADAAGVVIRDLPLTPERVWAAIQAAGSAEQAAQ